MLLRLQKLGELLLISDLALIKIHDQEFSYKNHRNFSKSLYDFLISVELLQNIPITSLKLS
jgi:hypothetical protein